MEVLVVVVGVRTRKWGSLVVPPVCKEGDSGREGIH